LYFQSANSHESSGNSCSAVVKHGRNDCASCPVHCEFREEYRPPSRTYAFFTRLARILLLFDFRDCAHCPEHCTPDEFCPPSRTYIFLARLGMQLLLVDFGSDIIMGIYNIVSTDKVTQGVIGIIIVIFPILQHKTSDYYKRQEFLIQLDEAQGEWFGVNLLKTGIFDPIIWSYNHYLAADVFSKDRTEENRKSFYVAKQMAQLSLKVRFIISFAGYIILVDAQKQMILTAKLENDG